ncbi:unnamed protein product [Ranitomeya imitator]|uniref:Uncharacterized protein n=1 Tax=Ranitomeya imitator TaxID=111125 RepID=A0ABN9MB49_9NEOB|nr:unnamed protein product [Ranitomeya imitator]
MFIGCNPEDIVPNYDPEDIVCCVFVVSPDCRDDVAVKKDFILVRSFKDGKFLSVVKSNIHDIGDISVKNDSTLQPGNIGGLSTALQNAVDKPLMTGAVHLVSSSERGSSSRSSGSTLRLNIHALIGLHSGDIRVQPDSYSVTNGTPINKRPVLGYRTLNLFKLFRLVHKLGGFSNARCPHCRNAVEMSEAFLLLAAAAALPIRSIPRDALPKGRDRDVIQGDSHPWEQKPPSAPLRGGNTSRPIGRKEKDILVNKTFINPLDHEKLHAAALKGSMQHPPQTLCFHFPIEKKNFKGRYLYGFEEYCTSTNILFHMDLPIKVAKANKDLAMESELTQNQEAKNLGNLKEEFGENKDVCDNTDKVSSEEKEIVKDTDDPCHSGRDLKGNDENPANEPVSGPEEVENHQEHDMDRSTEKKEE